MEEAGEGNGERVPEHVDIVHETHEVGFVCQHFSAIKRKDHSTNMTEN